MSWGGHDPMYDGWDELGWEQRRERRFQKWLDAPGVEFADEGVREEYRGRVQLLIDAITLKSRSRRPAAGR